MCRLFNKGNKGKAAILGRILRKINEMMKTPVKIFSFLTILTLTTALKGQTNELMVVHTDRNKYVAGEDIWFSIYNTDESTGRLTPGSLVAYVELTGPWNTPVVQIRIRLNEGKGDGTFHLPDTISSGDYIIRAYTNRMKDNLPEGCTTKIIGIYNPFRASSYYRDTVTSDSLGVFSQKNAGMNYETVSILADSVFGYREKVAVKILATNTCPATSRFAFMSVSVTPSSVSDQGYEFGAKPFSKRSAFFNDFESKGHFLTLRIRSKEGGNSGRQNRLFMSVQGKVAGFRYAEKDSSGRYTFIIPADSRQRTYILQPEVPDNEMKLEIEPSFSPKLPGSVHFKDSLRGKETEIFESLSFNHQVNRIYGITAKSEEKAAEPGNILKRRFYGIPELEIILDDYIRLPDMTEVFFELVPGILLREGKNGYEVKITNPLTGTFYEEPPLIMIDGVILNDLSVLVSLDPELVEKIEVVRTPYLTGDLILHGIVNVITRSGDFSKVIMPDYAAIIPYRAVEPACDFVSPSYNDEQTKAGRKPDVRNTLYWNPSLTTGTDGMSEFEFWTPDVPGEYTITVRGVSGAGKMISATKSFIVK
ncbi:MAG TPA: hypothetical protein PLX08_01840 [Bacteroidales bacterium]|nr:hypothetical protein [Bacteroidales bacterium]